MNPQDLKAERHRARTDLPGARPGHPRGPDGRLGQAHRPGYDLRSGPRADPRRRPTRQARGLARSSNHSTAIPRVPARRRGPAAGLAYEYDPYFSLSIARVDPLPHQLEAVYDYFLKLPRIRFLLADDPGAGKTIMAGLLLKELKIRGLVKRTLIVTPANLTFQWQREMKDKFREHFEVIRSDVLRANYGQNPGRRRTRSSRRSPGSRASRTPRRACSAATGISIIVDEAHKMSAYSADKKTLAYQLGEALSEMTDHYLLMTATPHKGDPENFCLFLELLDRDVYGDVKSLEEAMRRHDAPVLPAPHQGSAGLVSRPRDRRGQEALHQARGPARRVRARRRRVRLLRRAHPLRRGPVDQGRARTTRARGRALGFTMAMLQRRFASSVYAVRRSLERMRDKRREDPRRPGRYRQEQIDKRLPDDFDELPEDEQQEIVASARRRGRLRRSRSRCARRSSDSASSIDQARALEAARGRDRSSRSCERSSPTAGHLRRPEDEAAHLHRAQGHARLPRWRRQGRPPARQAARVGPDGHADPRRHEDRRPRHAGHAHLRRARVPRRLPRSWSRPRRPARASTSSSAGS